MMTKTSSGSFFWGVATYIRQGYAAVEDLLLEQRTSINSKHRIICTRLDLTEPASIQSTKELIEKDEVAKARGLDVLINNAAICFNDPTLYGKVAYTPFQQQADITVRTNFFGTLNVIQTMLPLLLQQKTTSTPSEESASSPARIINIASSAGRLSILNKSKSLMQTFTSPDLTLSQLQEIMNDFIKAVQDGSHADKGYPNTCYGMSKCGIIALTRILAREYANYANPDSNINKINNINKISNSSNNNNNTLLAVYSVDPGYCATDQNNNQGMLPAARGAVTPVWLATLMPAARAVTMSGRHFYQEEEIAW
jgi:carbonyl reductase 1